jgi:hypothetical protein
MEALFLECSLSFTRCSRLSQPHLRGIQITDLLSDFLSTMGEFEWMLLDFISEMVPTRTDEFVVCPEIFEALAFFYEITDKIESIYQENLPGISELDPTRDIEQICSVLNTDIEKYEDTIINDSLNSFMKEWERIFESHKPSFSKSNVTESSQSCVESCKFLEVYVISLRRCMLDFHITENYGVMSDIE